MKHNQLVLAAPGLQLLNLFKSDRGAAYDALFATLVAQHAYLRQFISVLNLYDIVAPLITSMEEHVSARYATNAALAEDIAEREFDIESLLERIGKRLRRELVIHCRFGLWPVAFDAPLRTAGQLLQGFVCPSIALRTEQPNPF